MTDLCTFSAIRSTDTSLVGGKGLSLALLTAAGLPVPPGFCVTTDAFRRLRDQSLHADPELKEQILAAYRDLGGAVAVRSSATAEDGSAASFAGQQETILGVEGEAALLDAIVQCRASLDSERAVAYRRKQGVNEDELAMAVVVQRLVPAEVAGVLFTRDPLDPAGKRMLVEASWGLGESVVSGRVMPDRFHLDRDSGKVLEQHVACKTVQRIGAKEEPVPSAKQSVACLDERRLAELAELGRRVEEYFKEPRDIEWAYADGKFWLLQARPITAAGMGEREQVRREEIAALNARKAPGGTVWSKFNLSEVLPAPTPMTWAIVRRFMSGRGGFGLMYRDLGFDPDPALDEEGIFDLICGRPFCNLSREPRLHYRNLPLEHSFARLKDDPRRALYPVPGLNPTRLPWHFWLLLPIQLPRLCWRVVSAGVTQQKLMKTFASQFVGEIAPSFKKETDAGRNEVLTRLDDAALLGRLDHWIRRTLVEFSRESLKPTALAALALGGLERKLATIMNGERARQLARDLVMGVHPAPESDLAGGVRDLAAGVLDRPAFLERFGHRGSEEMELARPRWVEDPTTLDSVAAMHVEMPAVKAMTPAERLASESRLSDPQRTLLGEELKVVHTYLGLRETAKHYLMYGYSLIRRVLLELDRRAKLQGGIFHLTPDELPRLVEGEDLSGPIAERRRRRSVALGLEVPAVLFSDDLDAIGRPMVVDGAESVTGVPVSAGVAEGPALVLEQPHAAEGMEGYILVCPSTDPAWVPLFVRARGLVMETGGVLSHGAIVGREFSLPAVVGVAGATRRFRTGQRLRVDGGQGTVTVLE